MARVTGVPYLVWEVVVASIVLASIWIFGADEDL